MFDILLMFLQNRLGLFLLGLAFVGGGIYGWQVFRKDVREFDAAAGKDGRTVEAKISYKGREMYTSDSDSGVGFASYLRVDFTDANGEDRSVKVNVSDSEANEYKDGGTIKIRFHPANPEYVLTPKSERPGVWVSTIAVIISIVLGVLIMLAVIISFF